MIWRPPAKAQPVFSHTRAMSITEQLSFLYLDNILWQWTRVFHIPPASPEFSLPFYFPGYIFQFNSKGSRWLTENIDARMSSDPQLRK